MEQNPSPDSVDRVSSKLVTLSHGELGILNSVAIYPGISRQIQRVKKGAESRTAKSSDVGYWMDGVNSLWGCGWQGHRAGFWFVLLLKNKVQF